MHFILDQFFFLHTLDMHHNHIAAAAKKNTYSKEVIEAAVLGTKKVKKGQYYKPITELSMTSSQFVVVLRTQHLKL
jgi:hypothetical protein